MENENRRSSWAPKPKLILDEPVISEPSAVETVHVPVKLSKTELAPPVRVSSSKAVEAPESSAKMEAAVVIASSVLAPPAPIQALPEAPEPPAVLQSEAGFASMDLAKEKPAKNKDSSQDSKENSKKDKYAEFEGSSQDQVKQYYEANPRYDFLNTNTGIPLLDNRGPSPLDFIDNKDLGAFNPIEWLLGKISHVVEIAIVFVWRAITGWFNK